MCDGGGGAAHGDADFAAESAAQALPVCDLARRCEGPLAHAWMVRTFVKHSEEAEDFPELMGIARSVFDLCMALESRVADEKAYRKMLSKKLPKLRKAAEQFAQDAPAASTHTNFQQAVVSVRAALGGLESALGLK